MGINIDYYTNYEDKDSIDKYNKFLKEYESKIYNIVKYILINENIKVDNVYIGIGVVSEQEIRKLNNEFRKVDKETDVLSFPIYTREEIIDMYNNEKSEEISIGDIVICMPVIEVQAKEFGTGFEREMLYMITHGMCHLMGYDHENDEDKVLMRKLEESILLKVEEF